MPVSCEEDYTCAYCSQYLGEPEPAKAAFKGLGFRVFTTAQESRPDCAETGVYKVLKRCL
jgi:hypothetical protein